MTTIIYGGAIPSHVSLQSVIVARTLQSDQDSRAIEARVEHVTSILQGGGNNLGYLPHVLRSATDALDSLAKLPPWLLEPHAHVILTEWSRTIRAYPPQFHWAISALRRVTVAVANVASKLDPELLEARADTLQGLLAGIVLGGEADMYGEVLFHDHLLPLLHRSPAVLAACASQLVAFLTLSQPPWSNRRGWAHPWMGYDAPHGHHLDATQKTVTNLLLSMKPPDLARACLDVLVSGVVAGDDSARHKAAAALCKPLGHCLLVRGEELNAEVERYLPAARRLLRAAHRPSRKPQGKGC